MFEFLELSRCGVMGWFLVGGAYRATGQTPHDAADEKEAAVGLLSRHKLLGCIG